MAKGRHLRRRQTTPRRVILVGGILGGLLGFGVVALASHGSALIDLTFAGADVIHDGARFVQAGVGAGTGNFDPFLQVQELGQPSDGIERGYNTEPNSNGEFDTKSITAGNTHTLRVSAVPVITVDGVQYREFSLDSNDTGSDSFMSIDEIKLFIDNQGELTGYDEATEEFSNDDDAVIGKVYDLDASEDVTILVQTQGLEPGSGESDMVVLIPNSVFPSECFYGSTSCNQFLIFWVVMGGYDDPSGERDYDADSGFEEWRVRLLPVVDVTKDAVATFDRTFDWTVQKEISTDGGATFSDAGTLDLFDGQDQDVIWKITADRGDPIDGGHQVNGTITITNPTGGDVIEQDIDAVINSVTDVLTGPINATVSCPETFPHTLEAGETLTCTYSSPLPNDDPRTNTATVNIDSDVEEGSTDYTGTADVIFGAPNETDATATLDDDRNPSGFPTGVTDGQMVSYNENLECDAEEGSHQNTAVLTEDDSGEQRTDTADLTVNCYTPTIDKTASGAFTETHTWTIDKSPDATYDRFIGDPAVTHNYLITVDETVTPSGFVVSGQITITNPHPIQSMTITDLTDVLDDATAATIGPCTGDGDLTDGLTVAAASSSVCDYTASDDGGDATENTASFSLFGISYSDTQAFTYAPSVVGPDSVNVTDDFGTGEAADDQSFGPFASDGSDGYPRDFTCPTDPAAYTDGVFSQTVVNTATIDETGASDTATVTLNCYHPLVSKTADTSFTRSYDWRIAKTNDAPDPVVLMPGQQFLVNYDVTVTLAGFTDSDHTVSGQITVENPAPIAMTVDLSDVLDDGTAASITGCTGDADLTDGLTIAAASSAVCDYTASDAGGDATLNTATATINGIGFSGSAAVAYGDPTVEVDETITVTDDLYGGTLGTVTVTGFGTGLSAENLGAGVTATPSAGPPPSVLFEYSRFVGPYTSPDQCGSQTVTNTATFTTNDTQTTGSASSTVNVEVVCELGCTLTQGYWKTHSEFGPAPYDDTWAQLPSGASTLFFLSGQTWYEVFWTSPEGGNVYYILAHQYMAAKLNTLNGASAPTEVTDAIASAEAWFAVTTPDQAAGFKGQARRTPLDWASTLAAYNEGAIGPGHCSEDSTSAAMVPLLLAGLSLASRGRHRKR